MNLQNRKIFIKKLLYQSCNRGCKETDIIMGEFAKLHLDQMSDTELKIFDQILKFADTDIYAWYTKKLPVPKKKNSALLTQILNFQI